MSLLCGGWLGEVPVDKEVLGVMVLGDDRVTDTTDVEARFTASIKE